MGPSPACRNGTCGGTCGRAVAHHCDSPGCTRRGVTSSSSAWRHCNSPGCTGGQSSSYSMPSNTQNKKRPKKNPHSLAATDDESYSEVVWTVETSSGVLAVVLYPAVAKFNGLKLAVYSVDAWMKLKDKLNKLDPHFYDDGESPLARFAPTRAGLAMAYAVLGTNGEVQKQHDAIIDQLLAYRNRALK